MTSSSESLLGSPSGAPPLPRGRFARFRQRAPVSTASVLVFLAALIAVAAAPAALVPHLMLIPAELTRPWNWYRLLTYALVQISFGNWLVVSGVILLGGWIAERWLDRRTMWIVAVISALSSGAIYSVLAPAGQPLVGGGFIAAGFAGAAVVSCALRRHWVSRGTQVVALALLLVYGLTPLSPDPASLAMLAAFVIAGVYAAFRLKSPVVPGPQREPAERA